MKSNLPQTPLTTFSFVSIVGLLMIVGFVVLVEKVGGDPGLGWHLKTGEYIATHLTVPSFDPFLRGFESEPWVCNQWLADLILYLVYSKFSWLGLHFFCFLVAFAGFFFVTVRSVLDYERPALAQNIGVGLAALCCSVHWITRPVVFSLLGFSLVDALIRSHRVGRISNFKFLLSLAVVFLTWSNLHPAFVLGIVLLGVYALSAVFERERLGVSLYTAIAGVIVAIGCSGINPNGFNLHLTALQLGRSSFFMGLNAEWLPPQLSNGTFTPFYVAIFFGLIGAFRVPGSLFETLKALVFAVLAFKGGRFVPFFGVAGLPAVTNSIAKVISLTGSDRFFSNAVVRGVVSPRPIMIGLIVAIVGLSFSTRKDSLLSLDPHYPMDAIDVAFNTHADQPALPVFHTPDWGGAIIWKTAPRRVAWIDDRNELNGEQKYRDFLTIENLGPGWRELIANLGFKRVLTRPATPLSQYLATSPEWDKLHEDRLAVVYQIRTE